MKGLLAYLRLFYEDQLELQRNLYNELYEDPMRKKLLNMEKLILYTDDQYSLLEEEIKKINDMIAFIKTGMPSDSMNTEGQQRRKKLQKYLNCYKTQRRSLSNLNNDKYNLPPHAASSSFYVTCTIQFLREQLCNQEVCQQEVEDDHVAFDKCEQQRTLLNGLINDLSKLNPQWSHIMYELTVYNTRCEAQRALSPDYNDMLPVFGDNEYEIIKMINDGTSIGRHNDMQKKRRKPEDQIDPRSLGKRHFFTAENPRVRKPDDQLSGEEEEKDRQMSDNTSNTR